MARAPTTRPSLRVDVVRDRVDGALASLDPIRRGALVRAASLESVKAAALAREQARLETKHGAGSPEAARAALRREAHAPQATALVALSRRVAAPAADPDESRSIVHGHVVGADRQGLAGLTVRAVDGQGRALATAATDDSGYFRLDVPSSAEGTFSLVVVRGRTALAETAETFAATPGSVRRRLLVVGEQ